MLYTTYPWDHQPSSQEATPQYSSSPLRPPVNSDRSSTMPDQGTAANTRVLGFKTATAKTASFIGLQASSRKFLASTENGSYLEFIQVISEKSFIICTD